MPIAVGDWLLSRSKHRKDGLQNQERVQVDGFDVYGNPIAKGKSITHRNLTYGEAFTVRAVQGSSTTMIISGMDRRSTSNWTREIAYVVASRGRQYCKFFVESIVDLAGVQRSGARMAATEMVLKDGQVLRPDVTELMRQIDKVKAERSLQERLTDLQAGARRGGQIVDVSTVQPEERKSALDLINRALKNVRGPNMPHAMRAEMERQRARKQEMGITR